MRTTPTRQVGPLGTDRALVDAVREANELRRSRALPEYQPRTTTFRVPSRRCFSRVRAGTARRSG
jgi:hypothetical protein